MASDPIATAIQIVQGNPVLFYPLVAGIAAVLALYFYRDFLDDDIEGKTLDERIQENVEPVADLFGLQPKKRLVHGFHRIGHVVKVLEATTVVKARNYQEIDETDQDAILVFKTRPPNADLFAVLAWFLVDVVLGTRKFGDIIVVDRENVDIGGEITIDQDAKFMYRGGVYVQKSPAGSAFILETAFQDILDDSLETFGDIAEVIQEMNVQHAMNIAEIEKQMELESKYDRGRKLGAINK